MTMYCMYETRALFCCPAPHLPSDLYLTSTATEAGINLSGYLPFLILFVEII